MLDSRKLAVVIAIPIVTLVVICLVWVAIWRYVPKGENRISQVFDRRDDHQKSTRQGIKTPPPPSSASPPNGLRQYQPPRTSYPRPNSFSRLPPSSPTPLNPTGSGKRRQSGPGTGVADAQYPQYAERAHYSQYARSETMANSTNVASGSGSSAAHFQTEEQYSSTMPNSPRTGTPRTENALLIQQQPQHYSPSPSPSQSQFHTHTQPQVHSPSPYQEPPQLQPQIHSQHRPHLQARAATVQRHDISELVSFLDGPTGEEVCSPPSYRSRTSGDARSRSSSFRFSRDGTAKSITFSPLSNVHHLPQLHDEDLEPQYAAVEEASPLDTLVGGDDETRDRKSVFTGGPNTGNRAGSPLAFHMPRYPPAVIVNRSVETHAEGPRILGKSPPGAIAKMMPPIASVTNPGSNPGSGNTTPKRISFSSQTHPRRTPSAPPILPPIPTSPTKLSPLSTEHSLDGSGEHPHEPPSILPNMDESPTDTPLTETRTRESDVDSAAPVEVPPVPELPMAIVVEASQRKESIERVANVVRAERKKRKEKQDQEEDLPTIQPERTGSSTMRDRDGLESGWY